ncbi:hypothetical protein LHFGNBLO_004947 [Mesorhizobium sp. AR10]|uniref:hypothetical protein n=1 Tax=Mesorhizobium sp. AR10 TaxID=2865839 RepID=UPI002160545C|nr:hypothetical protein [Mesorhizobium sp. AR10]UVK37847.1 hypothetical protein LHFGNBLO_004947 [Mesorhizobium sp. AR10]
MSFTRSSSIIALAHRYHARATPNMDLRAWRGGGNAVPEGAYWCVLWQGAGGTDWLLALARQERFACRRCAREVAYGLLASVMIATAREVQLAL